MLTWLAVKLTPRVGMGSVFSVAEKANMCALLVMDALGRDWDRWVTSVSVAEVYMHHAAQSSSQYWSCGCSSNSSSATKMTVVAWNVTQMGSASHVGRPGSLAVFKTRVLMGLIVHVTWRVGRQRVKSRKTLTGEVVVKGMIKGGRGACLGLW